MTGFSFRKNACFEWNGAAFRVREIAPNEDALLESVGTGALSLVPMDTLLADYAEGRVRIAQGRPHEVAVKGRPLDELDPELSKETKRRLHYLRVICSAGE